MKKIIYLCVSMVALAAGAACAGGDPQAGKEKAAVCAGCHGMDGNSEVGANPRLAGQYESYLLQALKRYKSGQRKDLLMGNMVAPLSLQDMKDLAAWFASQEQNVLLVLPDD